MCCGGNQARSKTSRINRTLKSPSSLQLRSCSDRPTGLRTRTGSHSSDLRVAVYHQSDRRLECSVMTIMASAAVVQTQFSPDSVLLMSLFSRRKPSQQPVVCTTARLHRRAKAETDRPGEAFFYPGTKMRRVDARQA